MEYIRLKPTLADDLVLGSSDVPKLPSVGWLPLTAYRVAPI